MTYQLRTLGHATLVVLENDQPVLATDPWLIGSAYWRSWWLEKYPTAEEMQLVARARELYITHSHPDHFHWPSLRRLGKPSTLHPRFPEYCVPQFLRENGFPARTLEPWQWNQLGENVRIASVPVPIDDSVLVIDTPNSCVVNLNDSSPRLALLHAIRRRLIEPGKRVVVLKSYSPASMGTALFADGRRIPLKCKRDYVQVSRAMAEALGGTHFVPFASQAFFSRTDSIWANEYKVTFDDLAEHWGDSKIELCRPFTRMNLDDGTHTSEDAGIRRSLEPAQFEQVRARESEEAAFRRPADFDERLHKYLGEVAFLRLLFRRGIGWKLTDSGEERFYDCRTGRLEPRIPPQYDFVVSVPDQVLYEALCNNILTDLGITMFIRVDTQTSKKLTYGAFLLMGMHDYGHLKNLKTMLKFARFYLPFVFPALSNVVGSRPPEPPAGPEAAARMG